MNRPLALAFLVCLALACTPKRVIQASATIEDLPNEPEDAGVAAAAPGAGPAAPAPAPAASKRVEVSEGFSAEFPSDPVVQRATPQSKNGPVPTVTVSVNVAGVVYAITRQDYPEATVAKAGPKKMLTQSRLDVTRDLKDPKVSDEKDVELAGFPGKTFLVTATDRVVKARSAVVQNSLYTMVVVFSGPAPGNADAFLSSLELKNPPPPPPPAPAPAPAPAK